MRILSESLIHHPRDRVYTAYRDELPRIAEYVDRVTKIEVASREELEPGPKLHNIWYATGEIPKVARPFIKPEMLMWDDYAQWRDADHFCEWELKTRFFTDNIRCFGRSVFTEASDGHCRVVLDGTLEIDLAGIRGIPRLLQKRVGPQVEKFVVKLITPNLKKTNTGIERYLDSLA